MTDALERRVERLEDRIGDLRQEMGQVLGGQKSIHSKIDAQGKSFDRQHEDQTARLDRMQTWQGQVQADVQSAKKKLAALEERSLNIVVPTNGWKGYAKKGAAVGAPPAIIITLYEVARYILAGIG
jgi:chromosome segregation ATPase